MRLCTASRAPLDQAWTRDPLWSQVVRQLELRPLDQVASFQLIEALGLDHFETCHYLARTARGLPRALQTLCRDTLD